MGLLDYLDGGSAPRKPSYREILGGHYNSTNNAPPPMLARPPAPKPAYQPPAPSWSPANSYVAPIQNYQPVYQPSQTVQQSFSPAVTDITPAPPPPPPRKTIEDYKALYDTDDELAGVDSTFGEQKSAYKNALDKFLLQDKEGRGRVNRDYDNADTGIERNRVAGLTQLSEDFAARGLGRSGLFLDSQKDAVNQYGRQKDSSIHGRKDAISDMDNRKVKMETDTTNNTAAARREAYARLAAKQDLV